MCMACEQAEMYFRWQLLEQIAKGEMPEGMSESDLRAMQLPLPGEVARFEEPDGNYLVPQSRSHIQRHAEYFRL